MTRPGNDFGETLRRALSVAGRVEPADDGLERIRAGVRARTQKPRLAAALALVFPWPVYRLLQYRTMAGDVLRQFLAALIAARVVFVRWLTRNTTAAAREIRRAGTAAGQPRHAAEHDAPSGGIGWIRPALAAASVAFAATLAMTVPPVRQAIVQLGSSVMSTGQSQSGSGTLTGHGSKSPLNSAGPSSSAPGSPGVRPSATTTPSCATTANPAPSGGATGTANATPTAQQSGAACATPSPVIQNPTFPPSSPTASAPPTTPPPTTPPPTTPPPTNPPPTNPPAAATTPADTTGQVTSAP